MKHSILGYEVTTAFDAPTSGDVAYTLFCAPITFPLHDLLDAWKAGEVTGDVGYILAIIGAYNHMLSVHDGKRDGTYRPIH
jgi:hypothetical protein